MLPRAIPARVLPKKLPALLLPKKLLALLLPKRTPARMLPRRIATPLRQEAELEPQPVDPWRALRLPCELGRR